MYACVRHPVYHLNALCKLILKRSLEINVLDEWTDADFPVIEYLVPTLLAYGKSLFCHIQAKLIDMLFWNVDTCPAGA